MGSMGGVAARRSPLTTVISGSIPGLGVIRELSHSVCCWFSPLLRGFLSGVSCFPPSAKIDISKFQFDHGRGPQVYQLIQLSRATLVKQSRLFIYLFIRKSNNYKLGTNETFFKMFLFIYFTRVAQISWRVYSFAILMVPCCMAVIYFGF
jgi:hypothetical protein